MAGVAGKKYGKFGSDGFFSINTGGGGWSGGVSLRSLRSILFLSSSPVSSTEPETPCGCLPTSNLLAEMVYPFIPTERWLAAIFAGNELKRNSHFRNNSRRPGGLVLVAIQAKSKYKNQIENVTLVKQKPVASRMAENSRLPLEIQLRGHSCQMGVSINGGTPK